MFCAGYVRISLRGMKLMATLRAAALLLDGALIVIGLWLLNRLVTIESLRDASGILMIVTILITPVVNAVAVILQARNRMASPIPKSR